MKMFLHCWETVSLPANTDVSTKIYSFFLNIELVRHVTLGGV